MMAEAAKDGRFLPTTAQDGNVDQETLEKRKAALLKSFLTASFYTKVSPEKQEQVHITLSDNEIDQHEDEPDPIWREYLIAMDQYEKDMFIYR